jgi:Cd2+/Zn2+-exporting ATPase
MIDGIAFQTDILALAGAVLLGAPIVWHAIRSLLRKETHMDELVALAIVAAIATQQYVAAGTVAFFMLLSELVESRTALGARVR